MGTKQPSTTRHDRGEAAEANPANPANEGNEANRGVSTGIGAGHGLNQAIIIGQLVREAERRTLPSGSLAASFSLTVRAAGQKTTSVPIVWYDPPKRMAAWKLGEMIVVRGQVVRRFFRGAGGLGSSTEVVVDQADLVRHGTKQKLVLDRAVHELTQFSGPTEKAR